MTATYTLDVFSTLDGFGSYSGGNWGGYWGKQGPELLDRRVALYSEEERMVLGANTFRAFALMLARTRPERSRSGLGSPGRPGMRALSDDERTSGAAEYV